MYKYDDIKYTFEVHLFTSHVPCQVTGYYHILVFTDNISLYNTTEAPVQLFPLTKKSYISTYLVVVVERGFKFAWNTAFLFLVPKRSHLVFLI